MVDLKRVIRMQVFSEANDKFRGPSWAVVAFVFVSLVAYLSIGWMLVAMWQGNQPLAWRALASMVGSFAVTCGLAWNYGMQGRAKNGLILTVVMAVLILAVKNLGGNDG